MSILDKLPKAPEGYEWRTSVFLGSEGETIYLELNPESPLPLVPESFRATSGFSKPNEASLIITAVELLERFDSAITEAQKAREEQYLLNERYAHLLTPIPRGSSYGSENG